MIVVKSSLNRVVTFLRKTKKKKIQHFKSNLWENLMSLKLIKEQLYHTLEHKQDRPLSIVGKKTKKSRQTTEAHLKIWRQQA